MNTVDSWVPAFDSYKFGQLQVVL